MTDETSELTAEAILNANDVKIDRVEVPEWGGHIFVKSLSGTQREKYLESIREIRGKGKNQDVRILLVQSSAKLAAATICDKNGRLLFTPAQVAALGEKSSKALQRVVDASAKLNGFSDDAEEEAKNDSPVPAETDFVSSSA